MKKIGLILGIIIFVVLAVGSVGGSSSSSSTSGSSSKSSEKSSVSSVDSAKKEKTEKPVEMGKIGEPYVTNHFEVTVSKIQTVDSLKVDTFTYLDKEEGVKYLIITVSAKNIANESKSLISAGKVILGDGEDKIQITSDETMLSEGYGAFLEGVNPKLTKKTKLVYKIPADYADKSIVWDAFGSKKYMKIQ